MTSVRIPLTFARSLRLTPAPDDEANAAQHARRNAQAAINAAKQAASAFDVAAANGVASSAKAAAPLDCAHPVC